MAEALAASGRMSEAADTCQALLGASELGWEQRVTALRLLGRARYLTGSQNHGEAAMQDAVALAAAEDPSAAVEPLLYQSLAAWLADGPARALSLADRARELARRADRRLQELAEATWGHLAYETGDPAGLEATDAIVAASEDAPLSHLVDPAALAWPWAPLYQVAMNANYAGRYADSHDAFQRAAASLERAGSVNALATVSVHLANIAVRRGHLEDALRHAARAEEFADLTPTVLPYAQLVRAEALVWAGRFEESEACCRRAEGGGGGQWFARLWLAYVRGMRLLWQGDARSSDHFLCAEEVTTGVGIREPCHMQWQSHAVAAHLAAGRRGDAQRVVSWLEETAASLPCPWPAAAGWLSRARIAGWDGEGPAAGAAFEAALSLLGGAELPLHHADALLGYGSHLRQQGRNADARVHLALALELAEAGGAAHLAATAREELSLAGGRRRRAVGGGPTLTAAELRVARQAACGLSNAEIARALYLSVNTVETHLNASSRSWGSRLGVS